MGEFAVRGENVASRLPTQFVKLLLFMPGVGDNPHPASVELGHSRRPVDAYLTEIHDRQVELPFDRVGGDGRFVAQRAERLRQSYRPHQIRFENKDPHSKRIAPTG